ncbi:hypothetical protein [Pseudomonas sp. NPDC089569]|uniref:hypothetical protein n=1 Tax=Pseudomonas sp. NPDC089569 TaxID=3390722 RepID=UPI003D00B948
MPMIQIEQDSPELIAQVRSHIVEMVERTRKHPSIAMIAEEFVAGYMTSLLEHHLLSGEQWKQLSAEMRAAAHTARTV